MRGIKICTIILTLLTVLMLNGCNFDNLILIDHNLITGDGDRYNFYHREITVDTTHLEIDYVHFNGVQTIWRLDVTQNSYLRINYHSQLISGKCKIVVITPEREIINVFEEATNGYYNLNITEGKYLIKIIGMDGKGYLEADLTVGDHVNVNAFDH